MSRPNEEASTDGLFDPFGLGKAWRESSMETWSKAMVDFVNSEAYSRASAQWLDSYLTMSQSFQQVTNRLMTEALNRYQLPSTADIDRLAERMINIELRLDDLDARLDEVLGILKGLTDTVTATARAVEKTERAAERVGHSAGEAKQAAELAARTAEKAVERVSRRVERAAGEAGQAAEHAAEAVERVAAAALASKNNTHGHPAEPVAPEESTQPRRQERK